MSIEIRLAEAGEIDKIYDFYKEVCKELEGAKYSPLWQIGFYPCIEDIKNHIHNKNMYIAVTDGRIASVMATVNHGDYSSLHLFAVHSDFRNQHLGKQMMNKLFEISKERGNSKVILDVVKGNLPAEKLYQKMGFDYIGEKTEYIERVGNVDFNIYEYNI
ncbi:MAG: GNAT family N-acetyltransferase [Eubacterium sp.]|nr:GNAT family N-acetyltransferase [Eubacterium sp.]